MTLTVAAIVCILLCTESMIVYMLPAYGNSGVEANPIDRPIDRPTHCSDDIRDCESPVRHHVDRTQLSPILGTIGISSRLDLLNKVYSPQELETIVTKFRSFVDDASVSSVDSSLGKVHTTPTGSYSVLYSWEPANVITKEKHSILMLKFTDAAGNIIKNSDVSYDILIKDPNGRNIVFQKHGFTPTGVDLKIIDANSFPTGGSTSSPVNYDVEIDVDTVGGNMVSEHASLSKVGVISYSS